MGPHHTTKKLVDDQGKSVKITHGHIKFLCSGGCRLGLEHQLLLLLLLNLLVVCRSAPPPSAVAAAKTTDFIVAGGAQLHAYLPGNVVACIYSMHACVHACNALTSRALSSRLIRRAL
eukprot:196806-Chlamydomonas_euryale.AAC.1